jgi:hypothetical protein
MTGIDNQTQILAKIYYAAWIFTIVSLVGAGLIYSLGSTLGIDETTALSASRVGVQIYLVLVPLAILVFAVWMAVVRQWKLALTGIVLSLIWVGAKLLG